jgi:hypothetical protein
MSRFFFPEVPSESPLYKSVRDDPRCAVWRSFVEQLWLRFEPLAPNGFRERARGSSEHRAAFAQCLAEMWIGVGLHEQLGARVSHGGEGQPDFRIELADGRACWVEVTAPEPGMGDDRVSELPTASTDRPFVTFPYSSEPKLLRITGSLREKTEKFKGYRDKGVVRDQDLTVIAISEFALGDHANVESSFELLISALEGVGNPVVSVGGPLDVSHATRVSVRKRTGSEIATTGWRSGSLEQIDAVIYSNLGLDGASRAAGPDDWCWAAAAGIDDERLGALQAALSRWDRLERRDDGERVELTRIPGDRSAGRHSALDGLFARGPIERTIAVSRLDDQPSEVDAWAGVDGVARLEALLNMRERWARWRHGAEPRLERVLAVARRT